MAQSTEGQTISVVVPCYNSEHTVREVAIRSANTLRHLGFEPEVILVNDCSKDGTLATISSLAAEVPWVIAIDFAKNFGQHNALLAGIRHATGDYIIGIDDDLQTPPEEISRLLKLLDDGADLVFGIPDTAQYQAYRSLGSRFNRWCACFLTDRPKGIHTSSFWCARRFVVEEAARQQNPLPQIQSAFFEATNNVRTCVVKHDARTYGHSGYTLKKLIRQWGRLASYSSKLLEVFAVIAFTLAALSIVVCGVASITGAGEGIRFFILSVICSAILVGLALNGLYLGRIVQMIRGKPSYVIRNIYGSRD